MTLLSRTLAALTIFTVAGVTAGCGSSEAVAPTAQAKSTPSASTPATTSTPSAGKTDYCALLAVANKAKPPTGKAVPPEDMKKFGKLLQPAATAASAAGKKEVGDFLSLLAKMNSDPLKATAKDAETAFSTMGTVIPIVLKDCNINLMK